LGLWDPDKIERIVGNLVANGIKYGAGNPIELCVENTGPRARITVRDRGIGIDAKDQKRIFERFERSVSVQNYGGFGIGLWIARRLTEAMGGAIRVDSELGKGSTFVVELPIQRAPCTRLEEVGA
jgi:signal transduction histidine kinase